MKQKILNSLGLTRRIKQFVSTAIDYVVLIGSFVIANALAGSELLHWPLSAGFLVIAALTIYGFWRMGLYRVFVRYASEDALVVMAVGLTLSTAAVTVFTHFYMPEKPVAVSLIYWFVSFALMGGVRLMFRRLLRFAEEHAQQHVIIYGAGEAGRQLATALQASHDYAPVAILDDDDMMLGTTVMGLQVSGTDDLEKLVKRYAVSKVLLAIPSASRSTRRAIIARLQNSNVEIQTIPGMTDIVEGRMRVDDLRSVSVNDLLGREPVKPVEHLIQANTRGKNVLITGAGGSIGSELCRQILTQKPKVLVLYEVSEFALYAIHSELMLQIAEEGLETELKPLLGSVQNRSRLTRAMCAFQVHTVYHAAAYKHVPMVEFNVAEGVRNNIFGTWHAAESAIAAGVERFVLVSTDKAVRPTNVMGTTKRCAELVCQGLADRQSGTTITMVRFGNVLGSSGSVVPLFKRQIEAGGPVTVTHRDITRYFMTIPEAAQLVVQAGAMAQGGEVYVLDMGEPVKIHELAKHMVRLSGLSVRDEDNPEGDIALEFSGLRPGEKLYEELLIGENASGTNHPRINTAQEACLSWDQTVSLLDDLDEACTSHDHEKIRQLLLDAPTDFNPSDGIGDLIWAATRPEAG